ncbi:uncharacterized protein LAESUDRAFT_658293 [Laetiporus sulphureus 93-53]|uniref:Synaptobrevin n=1 Tax=Laetiporus sulphureus 93-53 TaxID=1314785 RepID=A0A165D4D4_9APHY|nr:uncharacterized protein LAESUDRAFT_658293 [Laetiporus sulphureus 93-53]KZT04135.1 hypothetical protein LAESUDRAFT_658293 [Laetiporus sulphureus 93-53]
MNYQDSEQVIHDRVNLGRLVRKLEKTVQEEDWDNTNVSSRPTWVKTQGLLQKMRYARKLLSNVEMYEDSPYADSDAQYERLRETINRLESVVKERVALKPHRPAPILPTIPTPLFAIRATAPVPLSAITPSASNSAGTEPISPDESTTITAQDLLLSPSDTATMLRAPSSNPSVTLLPPNLPSSPAKSTVTGTPAFLQNSAALQEELSAQLAQMATQLKRNAIHFADSLDKDKAVVLETQAKLERNHDVMQRERVRVRDHRSKSWGTTWLVLLSIMVAIVGFILTFFVIRFT